VGAGALYYRILRASYLLVSKEIILIDADGKKNEADNKTPWNICQYKIKNREGKTVRKLSGYRKTCCGQR
jgi:hypothetical protein